MPQGIKIFQKFPDFFWALVSERLIKLPKLTFFTTKARRDTKVLATDCTDYTENSQLCVLGERSSQSKLFQNVSPSSTSANRPFIKLTASPSLKPRKDTDSAAGRGKRKRVKREQGTFKALNFLTCSPPANYRHTKSDRGKQFKVFGIHKRESTWPFRQLHHPALVCSHNLLPFWSVQDD